MFHFGEFELDLDRYELRRGGVVVKTEPRVLELLDYLIEHRDRVVPKEELHDTLWPDVHVSESALTTTIRDVRRALDDSSAHARWIRTVYGRGFRFVGEVTEPTPVAEPAPQRPAPSPQPAAAEPRRKSMAVLPFNDLSPQRDQSHFCDGIAEELINTLTRIEDLRVVSRAAAFDLRADGDVRDLGRRLDVDHVLRGSVRKDGERLRISVHLIDVRTGHHLWSEKYDRQVGDIFALQEGIAENVARVLLGVLTERARTAIKSTPVRVDAYEFYLKGKTDLAQKTLPSVKSAIGMFELALEFDDQYAPAYTGLADALDELHRMTGDANLVRRAEAARRRAGAQPATRDHE